MAITCCKGCVPPKRTPTCHFDGTCQEYIEQKQKHEEEREARYEARMIVRGLIDHHDDAVKKAVRRKGKQYGDHK